MIKTVAHIVTVLLFISSVLVASPLSSRDSFVGFLAAEQPILPGENALHLDLMTVEAWNNSWTLNALADFINGYSSPDKIDELLKKVPQRGFELGAGAVSVAQMRLGELTLGLGLRNYERANADRRLFELAFDGVTLEELEDLELSVLKGVSSTYLDAELGYSMNLPEIADTLGLQRVSVTTRGHFLLGLALAEIDAGAQIAMDQESFFLKGEVVSTTYLALPSEGAFGIGGALDVVVTAALNDRFSARMLFLDLGAIAWSGVQRIDHKIEVKIDPDGLLPDFLVDEEKEWIIVGELETDTSTLSGTVGRTLFPVFAVDAAYRISEILTLGARVGIQLSNSPAVEISLGTAIQAIRWFPISASMTYRSDVRTIFFGVSGHLNLGNRISLGLSVSDSGVLFGRTKYLGVGFSIGIAF